MKKHSYIIYSENLPDTRILYGNGDWINKILGKDYLVSGYNARPIDYNISGFLMPKECMTYILKPGVSMADFLKAIDINKDKFKNKNGFISFTEEFPQEHIKLETKSSVIKKLKKLFITNHYSIGEEKKDKNIDFTIINDSYLKNIITEKPEIISCQISNFILIKYLICSMNM